MGKFRFHTLFRTITVLLIIIATCYSSIKGQVSVSVSDFLRNTEKYSKKFKNGYILPQLIKGKINGKGVICYSNGDCYIGSLLNEKPNGRGMYICCDTDLTDSIAYYVGKYKSGEKHGKGIGYATDGKYICDFDFDNGILINHYYNENNKENLFAQVISDEYIYIGELKSELPNGFGLIIAENESFLISSFKNGEREGVGISIDHEGNWISENYSNGIPKYISSSEEYDKLTAARKSYISNFWNQVLNTLPMALSQFSASYAVASTQSDNCNQNEINYSSAKVSDDFTGSSNTDLKKNISNEDSDKFNISEQRSYNSDKSTYAKYDSMLSQAYSGNRDASKSEIKSWQNKMKSIREKWTKKGKSFPKSSNESK